jgi:hypothetical protein
MERNVMSPEEFFERARKGEFMGAEVIIVNKPIVFTVEESQMDDWAEGGEWYVGDDNHGLYESYVDDIDHLVVKEKSND